MATTEQLDGATFELLSPAEVKERFDRNDIVLIDVRTPQEYAFEYIPGAMLFPMSSFDPAKLPIQTGKPIVFHCGSGRRSRTVAQMCAQAGLNQLAHMEGGFRAWQSAGFNYVAIDPATGGYVNKS
jgi:rhodanese-related sulfurtransferase